MGYDDGHRWTEWGHERQQSRNIGHLHDELQAQHHANRRTQRALKDQLSRLSGDLGARIDTIGNALDAFVELSDIRFELIVHQPDAALRAAVRRFLVAASDSSGTPDPALPATSGYWLGPAAEALAAVLTGGDPAASLDAARALDHRRTALFLTAALSATGRPDDAAAHLPDTVRGFHGELTRAQTALWRASAHGALGTNGSAFMHALLREHLASCDDAEAGKLWSEFTERRLRAPVQVGSAKAVGAAGKLGKLRDLCATALAAAPEPRPGGLFALVEDVVDEGAPLEAPLLRRSLELRAQIERRAAEPGTAEHFDDHVGTVDAVLAEAVAADDDPAVRARAVALAAPRLLALADGLLADASEPFTGATREVRRGGSTVTVTGSGVTPDLDVVRAEARERHVSPNATPWALAAAAAAVLAVPPAFVVPGLAILAGVVAAGLAIKWFAVRGTAREAAGSVDYFMEAFGRDVEEARRTIARDGEQAARAAIEAAGAHAEVVELLGEYR
ncbi:hypothetical protein [Phytomonospora endophytica]|uniref:Uncharacterized protein n=1 Tax=Phytomonospora endophytica TaxID=714109 RepID=A0A841FHJ4_9ACTN|nr:hypothetical protein [Phytomonospora endophytica]MBB6033318.1 hypothetical protein [Phytomonospora endophytica]GIG65545.1 hypothetical protein Pen01_18400 [Phytomonospora endophytica]